MYVYPGGSKQPISKGCLVKQPFFSCNDLESPTCNLTIKGKWLLWSSRSIPCNFQVNHKIVIVCWKRPLFL